MDSRRRALLAAGLGVYASGAFAQKQVNLPKIGLGTWQTFDAGNDSAARAPLREVLKLLDRNVVDSSPMYGSSRTATTSPEGMALICLCINSTPSGRPRVELLLPRAVLVMPDRRHKATAAAPIRPTTLPAGLVHHNSSRTMAS